MSEAPIKTTVEEWDAFFYAMAQHAATRSKDPDRKVGAVLVSLDRRQVSFGYNGFPPEVPDLPSLLADKQFKLTNMRHAEHNCLLQAPFNPRGCTLYVTRFPCLGCAYRIVDAGVKRLVAPAPDLEHPRWGESWSTATKFMGPRGVTICTI